MALLRSKRTGSVTWPADLGEERSALGACLRGQATEGVELLRVDDFSLPANRAIFLGIQALVERGESALEISLVAAELQTRGVLDSIGGVAYLEDLDFGVVLGRSMQSRTRILRNWAQRRRLLRMAEETERRALDPTLPVSDTIEWLRQETL
jgi:replicative DNA helicase